MLFSVTSISFGAELSSWMGGRYYSYFTTSDGDKGFNPAPGTDCWDAILYAKVTEGNTWAGIKFIADTWNQKIFYDFGINNIAGTPWSLGFDTHDTGTANLGQQFMGDLFNDYKADPLFNTCDMGGSVNVKYITDSFEFRGEAYVFDEDGSIPDPDTKLNVDGSVEDLNEAYALALIYKMDMGKVYIGSKIKDANDDPLYIVGADFNVNNLGVKFDIWVDESGMAKPGEFASAFWAGSGHTTFQTTLTYNKYTGQLMYSKLEDDQLDDIAGIGLAYALTEKATIGTKYFDCDAADDGFYDVYGTYDLGAWDLRAGVTNARFPQGNSEGPNSVGGHPSYGYNDQAVESDAFCYLGVHFEF